MEYEVQLVPMKDIFSDDSFNCRGHIIPMDVKDLALDIYKNGLDVPITIRPCVHAKYKYQIVTGHRRYLAFRINAAETIPAFIRTDLDDFSASALNLRENVARKQLNIQQEAHGLRRFFAAGWSEHDISKFVQQSRGWVQIRNVLLRLPEDIQKEAAAGILGQEQIKKMAMMSNDDRYRYVRTIKESRLRGEKIDLKVEKEKDVDQRQKSSRQRATIFSMIDYLLSTTGKSLATRALAWAAGELTERELHTEIEAYCDEHGLAYHAPMDIKETVTND